MLWRRRAGASGPFGVVAQAGEPVAEGYDLRTGGAARSLELELNEARSVAADERRLVPSKETAALIEQLQQEAFG